MSRTGIKTYIALHMMLMIYSLSGVCSKKASMEAFFSLRFFVYYSIIILLLGIYAVVWQQIIKYLPLTAAYANKAVTVIWGIVWGCLVFGEYLSIGKVIGGLLVIAGVVLFAVSEDRI